MISLETMRLFVRYRRVDSVDRLSLHGSTHAKYTHSLQISAMCTAAQNVCYNRHCKLTRSPPPFLKGWGGVRLHSSFANQQPIFIALATIRILRDLDQPLIRSEAAWNASIELVPQLVLHRIEVASLPRALVGFRAKTCNKGQDNEDTM